VNNLEPKLRCSVKDKAEAKSRLAAALAREKEALAGLEKASLIAVQRNDPALAEAAARNAAQARADVQAARENLRRIEGAKAGEIVWDRPRRGWQVGVKVLSTTNKLQPGDPVVVQLLLKNTTDEPRTVVLQQIEATYPVLGADGRISMNISGADQDRHQHTISPGGVLERRQYRVVLNTAGMLPGEYCVNAQPAFWEPNEDNSGATGIGRSTPIRFTLGDPESVQYSPPAVEKTPTQKIYWGQRVSGLVVGMRLPDGRKQWANDAKIQAELFVRNVSDRAIEFTYEVAPLDEWNMHVQTSDGKDVPLDVIWQTGIRGCEMQSLKLKPGEQAQLAKGRGPTIQVLKEKTPYRHGDPPRLITNP